MKYLQKLKSKKGFTLVECVIAIAVFSIMAALITMLLQAALSTHRDNMSETRSLRQQRRALNSGIIVEDGENPAEIVARSGSESVVFNFNGVDNTPFNATYSLTPYILERDFDIEGVHRRGLEVTGFRGVGAGTGGARIEYSDMILDSGFANEVRILFSSPDAGNLFAAGSGDWLAVQQQWRSIYDCPNEFTRAYTTGALHGERRVMTMRARITFPTGYWDAVSGVGGDATATYVDILAPNNMLPGEAGIVHGSGFNLVAPEQAGSVTPRPPYNEEVIRLNVPNGSYETVFVFAIAVDSGSIPGGSASDDGWNIRDWIGV
ncbi:MAG: prepilin-type N-terminal cleavage/methylation domain-containing protein [Oscillospiraceae bacterium]|nr:prepilin-type N-terminal cleavage/methylation domain-containing protein [Oscillospiraceae bacterium]